MPAHRGPIRDTGHNEVRRVNEAHAIVRGSGCAACGVQDDPDVVPGVVLHENGRPRAFAAVDGGMNLIAARLDGLHDEVAGSICPGFDRLRSIGRLCNYLRRGDRFAGRIHDASRECCSRRSCAGGLCQCQGSPGTCRREQSSQQDAGARTNERTTTRQHVEHDLHGNGLCVQMVSPATSH